MTEDERHAELMTRREQALESMLTVSPGDGCNTFQIPKAKANYGCYGNRRYRDRGRKGRRAELMTRREQALESMLTVSPGDGCNTFQIPEDRLSHNFTPRTLVNGGKRRKKGKMIRIGGITDGRACRDGYHTGDKRMTDYYGRARVDHAL